MRCLGLAREGLPRIKVVSLSEVRSAGVGSTSICHCLFLHKHVFALFLPSDTDFRGLCLDSWLLLCAVRGCFGAELCYGEERRVGSNGWEQNWWEPLGRGSDSTQELFLLLFHRLP